MSIHPQHSSGAGGSNPNYYAETSSIDNRPPPSSSPPVELPADEAEHPPRPPKFPQQYPAVSPLSPSQSQGQQQYFPPPPPGPPPSQSQQQHYPPPPPGPPPKNQTYHPLQSHPSNYTAASAATEPPAYTPVAAPGLSVTGPTEASSDEKPPALPPRPSSGQGGNVPYFPPPPGSAGSSRPGSSQGQGGQVPYFAPPPFEGQQQQTGHGGAAAAGTATAEAGVSATPPAKKGFGDRLYQWSIKAGVPINKITNKLGSEAWWPSSMDQECDKAARILKSFCKDGFHTSATSHPPPSPGHATSPGPSKESKSLVKIPTEAIKTAKGLAIFTTFRTGLHISGASGSGIVVARLADGSWSPPAGFIVHTLGAGFMVGLDIYDCVCVLRTDEAVKAFTRPRLSLGGEIAVVAGPVGAGAALDAAIGAGKPAWSYMKSRGFYAGVQADGTIIVERPGANAAFYGEEKISVDRILKGEVKSNPAPIAPAATTTAAGKDKKDSSSPIVLWPAGARQLMEVLKAAEGRRADEKVVGELGTGPTPGDLAGTEGVHHPESDKKTEGGMRYA